MTNPGNWPDPERTGVPMFPERDGIHLINMGTMIGMFWSATHQHYSRVKDWQRGMSPSVMSDFEYCGPCLTPAQISEMLTEERERCAKVCDDNTVSMQPDCEDTKNAINEMLETTAREIRNLGATP